MQHGDELTAGDTIQPGGGARAANAAHGAVLHIPLQATGPHTGSLAAVPTQRLPLVQPDVTTRPTTTSAAVTGQAEWTARHAGRLLGIALMVLALAGTVVLGARYYRTGGSQDLTGLVTGLGVLVVLWGILIVSTPQMVTLRGSVLTVWAGPEAERYDLADAAQDVDLTGVPGSAGWALLLHRPDGTARVLRRSDADSVVLDEVVRHHRDQV